MFFRRAMALPMPQSKRIPGLALAAVAFGMPVVALACLVPNGKGGSSSGSGTGPATPSTDPPVIQSLNMDNAALYPQANNMYLVSGTITYADDNDVVSKFQVQVPVIGKTYTFDVPDPAATAYGQPIAFTVSADPPLGGAGPTNYIVTLVNKSGAVSQGVEESMNLQ